jgi:tRNA pseudouridine13 synthase
VESSPLTNLHDLTADMPGIGGCIKERPEDFIVEELPLYEFSGQGEHVYLFIEKRGMNTHDVIRRLAKAFGVNRGAIGYAGLKDKQAVTRQHFSVYQTDPSRDQRSLERASHHPNFHILWSRRHTAKLRRGHHGGNRFIIYIRQVEPAMLPVARDILDVLVGNGAANYIGPQRFGYRQTSHLLGRMLLLGEYQSFIDLFLGKPMACESEAVRRGREACDQGDWDGALALWPRHLRHDRQAIDAMRQGKDARTAALAIDRSQRQLLLSAIQSAVFNSVLDKRIVAGDLGRLLPGDLAWKHDSRAVFAVDEEIAAQENGPTGRVSLLEVSPSGPMWGRKMTRAGGAVDQIELQALADHSLTVGQVDGASASEETGRDALVDGSRRPLRIVLTNPDIDAGVDEHGNYIRVTFELPRGAYATSILREMMKCQAAN